MTDQAKLKASLKKRLARLEAYRCHGADAYRVANFSSGWNRESNGKRWIESAEGAGLRVAGYADELTRIRHKGWYSDSSEGATGSLYRGIVLQLPARDNVAQFLAGYEDSNSDGILVDCSTIYTAGLDADEAKHDAALASDSFAEREAEKAREYDEAWQAGSRYARIKEDIASERARVKALVSEVKLARQASLFDEAATPNICATLRDTVRQTLAHVYKLREERDELASNVWHQLRDAFNDGAGEQVIA